MFRGRLHRLHSSHVVDLCKPVCPLIPTPTHSSCHWGSTFERVVIFGVAYSNHSLDGWNLSWRGLHKTTQHTQHMRQTGSQLPTVSTGKPDFRCNFHPFKMFRIILFNVGVVPPPPIWKKTSNSRWLWNTCSFKNALENLIPNKPNYYKNPQKNNSKVSKEAETRKRANENILG